MKKFNINSIYFYLAFSIMFHTAILFIPGLIKLKTNNHLQNNSEIVFTEIIVEEADKISDKTELHKYNENIGELYSTKESLITYNELLRSIIYKNLRYPSIARNNKLEGEAKINFTINRYGKLLNYKIIKGTGFVILDNEVKNVFKKIKKFPQFPEFIKEEALNFNLIISFKLTPSPPDGDGAQLY